MKQEKLDRVVKLMDEMEGVGKNIKLDLKAGVCKPTDPGCVQPLYGVWTYS